MNKLRKMMVAAALLAVASEVSSGQANAGEVLDRVLAAKALTVAVGTDWGAISHLNEKHELVGYDVDIAKGIAKFLGVEVKFVTPGWDIITAGAMCEGRMGYRHGPDDADQGSGRKV